MAKQAALAEKLIIDGVDLSGDIGSVQTISAPSQVFDMTAIGVSAHERILGKLDGTLEFSAFFNDATGAAHPTLKVPGGADKVVSYLHGAALGNWAAGIVAKQTNYDPTRNADGSLLMAVSCIGSAYGLDHCDQVTAGLRTDTAATNGAAVDNDKTAATTKGLSAYLQVTAFTGTSITVKLQDSADGTTDWQDVTGGGFAAASAVGAQRIVTSLTLTVRRFLRVVSSGTFNPCTFSVVVCRSPAQ